MTDRVYEAEAVFKKGTEQQKNERALIQAKDPTKAFEIAIKKWNVPQFNEYPDKELTGRTDIQKGGFFVKDSLPDEITLKRIDVLK